MSGPSMIVESWNVSDLKLIYLGLFFFYPLTSQSLNCFNRPHRVPIIQQLKLLASEIYSRDVLTVL